MAAFGLHSVTNWNFNTCKRVGRNFKQELKCLASVVEISK